MPPLKETVETKSEKPTEYTSELRGILSKQLTPESIDTYATGALDDLINLVYKTTNAFSMECDLQKYETMRQMETAAFDHFGLGDIESILDHIAGKVDEINDIDKIIAGASITPDVIVPPGPSQDVFQGDGSYEKKKSIHRTKTVLFVLGNDFDVDLHDPQQFQIHKSEVSADSLRRESYYCVEALKLHRMILVCDEEENATYVFDTAVMKKLGVSCEGMQGLMKTEMNDSITQTPLLGTYIKYTAKFVPRLVVTIREPGKTPEELAAAELRVKQKYLYPKPNKITRSMSGMAGDLGIEKRPVSAAIAALNAEDKLGYAPDYNFHGHVAHGYDLYQQAVIENYCWDRGLLLDPPPEGVTNMYRFVRNHKGFGEARALKAVDALIEQGDFGKVERYKFTSNPGFGYDQQQQQMILDYLAVEDKLTPEAPEDYLSKSGMSDRFGPDNKTMTKTIKAVTDAGEMGETKTYKFGHQKGPGYSPEQQVKIYKWLYDNLPANGRLKQ